MAPGPAAPSPARAAYPNPAPPGAPPPGAAPQPWNPGHAGAAYPPAGVAGGPPAAGYGAVGYPAHPQSGYPPAGYPGGYPQPGSGAPGYPVGAAPPPAAYGGYPPGAYGGYPPGYAPPGYPAPGYPPAGYPAAAYGGHAPRRTHLVAAVRPPSGHGFVAMATLSMKRAFRLRIDANEVLDDERAALLQARPAVSDETQQAFLAWRRSVLFMAALLMVPVALLHALESLHFEAGTPEGFKTLTSLASLVEIGFAVFLWTQVPRWTKWKRQARALSWAWLGYFLTPFLVFLYPLASSYDMGAIGAAGEVGGDGGQAAQAAKMAIGIAIGAKALVSLAPKIISLLQGMIRASIATKTLFPGASAPGWLMVIAAPLYMIIFYVFVLLPYHFTDSGLVVLGMILVLAAKGTLVRAGLGLTRPMLGEVARKATQRALSVWVMLLLSGALCIVAGLWDLVSQASPLSLFNFALSMAANILLLTLICTDAFITGLDRARGTTDEERGLAAEVQAQLAAFTTAGTHEEPGPGAAAPTLPPPALPPPASPPHR
jgi:hypothetical protein